MNDFDRAVAGLYWAAGDKAWGIALGRVTTGFDGFGCQFGCIDNQTQVLTYSGSFDSVPAEGELEYVKTFFHADPRLPMLLKHELGD